MSDSLLSRLNPEQPIHYDPVRQKFIYPRDIMASGLVLTDIEQLTNEDKKKLVLERLRTGEDFIMQSISGQPATRDQVVKAVMDDTELGKMTIESQISMLKDIHEMIRGRMQEE